MKKMLTMLGLMLGLATVSHAGTPQGSYYSGQAPFSNTTILASSASATGTATLTLTVSTPTAINSGGGTYTGRNCFTKFIVQVGTYSVVTVADNQTTKWTIYGAGLGTTGTNTKDFADQPLEPFCTAAGDQTVFTITPTNGLAANPESINVEGYTTFGGTLNAGPMY